MATVEERFWEKVKVGGPNDCWEWTSTRYPTGYGIMYRSAKPRRWYLAHRLSWELHFGAIPEGKIICHHCDNPPCVNPVHLFLGTKADNARDRAAKRRGRESRQFGEANPRAKLTEADVRDVLARLRRGETQTAVAESYGVRQGYVSKIANGQYWRHVPR